MAKTATKKTPAKKTPAKTTKPVIKDEVVETPVEEVVETPVEEVTENPVEEVTEILNTISDESTEDKDTEVETVPETDEYLARFNYYWKNRGLNRRTSEIRAKADLAK